MHHRGNNFIRLLCAFAALLLLPLSAAADPAALLAEKLDHITNIQAMFVQTTRDPRGDMVSVSEGKLLVGENGRFNIQTS